MGTPGALAFIRFLNKYDNKTKIEEFETILNNPQTLQGIDNETQKTYNLVKEFLRYNKEDVMYILKYVKDLEQNRDPISRGKNIKLSNYRRNLIIREIENLYDIGSKKKTKRRRIKKKQTKRRKKPRKKKN